MRLITSIFVNVIKESNIITCTKINRVFYEMKKTALKLGGDDISLLSTFEILIFINSHKSIIASKGNT